jgi:hypothetical protein
LDLVLSKMPVDTLLSVAYELIMDHYTESLSI